MNIGNWIARFKGPRRTTSWHLVDSTVAGDAFTRCGRRMDRVTRSGGELQVRDTQPLTRAIGQPQLCKAGCDNQPANAGLQVDIREDDASTVPVEAEDVP